MFMTVQNDYPKNGLSGLIRAKNEERFLISCIDSCIDSLDELIVVYNDCTDDTEKILEEKVKQYPEKLKIYPFNHNILSHNLTREEFEHAIALPENSKQLHSTQCNYALSKVSCKYAMKIDPDQVYFADELAKWRDVCSQTDKRAWKVSFLLGWFFMMYISFYRRLSTMVARPCLWMIPDGLISFFKKSYGDYIRWRLQKGDAAVSFSGVNLFYDGTWTIPFDKYNVHPPYNGEGDTLLFKVSSQTFYKRNYDESRRPYTVVERFQHPYKVLVADTPLWFHLHANRASCFERVSKTRKEHPELFVSPDDFVQMNYQEVHNRMDAQVPTLFQRILFALVHKMGLKVIRVHLGLLDHIKLEVK